MIPCLLLVYPAPNGRVEKRATASMITDHDDFIFTEKLAADNTTKDDK